MRVRSMNGAVASTAATTAAKTAILVFALVVAVAADAAAQAGGAGAAGAPAGRGAAPAGGQGQGRAGGGRGGGRGAAPASAPTPRWPDGKPILGSVPGQPVGGWGAGVTTLPQRQQLDEIPFQPWARAAYDIRQIDQFEPHTRCKASGVSRQFSTPYGTEFVEVARPAAHVHHGQRRSQLVPDHLPGRPRRSRQDIPPTNYGYSIGHWEGDTLVVETRGLNEKFWLDTRGTPHTAQLKFTERFTRSDMNTMRYQATIDDPGAYTKPWTTTSSSCAGGRATSCSSTSASSTTRGPR